MNWICIVAQCYVSSDCLPSYDCINGNCYKKVPTQPPKPSPYEPEPYEPLPPKPAPYEPEPYNPLPPKPSPYEPEPYRPLPPKPSPYEPTPYKPLPPKSCTYAQIFLAVIYLSLSMTFTVTFIVSDLQPTFYCQ